MEYIRHPHYPISHSRVEHRKREYLCHSYCPVSHEEQWNIFSIMDFKPIVGKVIHPSLFSLGQYLHLVSVQSLMRLPLDCTYHNILFLTLVYNSTIKLLHFLHLNILTLLFNIEQRIILVSHQYMLKTWTCTKVNAVSHKSPST